VASTRPVRFDDVGALSALVQANRQFLAPWEPIRPEDYFTTAGQEAVLGEAVEMYERGAGAVRVIIDDDGGVVGRITLSGVVRGALQSCAMSYWVDAGAQGRGLATKAVREMLQVAFGELALHRVQAETLLHNIRSQRVLERNGFTRFGVAPGYLKIAGRWQDHAMYQLLNP
jgi:[ribosomal protein S5]-alanine N-acetyltransferase